MHLGFMFTANGPFSSSCELATEALAAGDFHRQIFESLVRLKNHPTLTAPGGLLTLPTFKGCIATHQNRIPPLMMRPVLFLPLTLVPRLKERRERFLLRRCRLISSPFSTLVRLGGQLIVRFCRLQ